MLTLWCKHVVCINFLVLNKHILAKNLMDWCKHKHCKITWVIMKERQAQYAIILSYIGISVIIYYPLECVNENVCVVRPYYKII